MILGEKNSYTLQAPPGWLIDLQLAQSLGVSTAIRSELPGVVMYSFSATKGSEFHSLEEYLAFNKKQLESDGSSLHVEKKTSIESDWGPSAEVFYYSGGSNGRTEAGAYFETTEAINLIILTAPDEKLFRKALPAFEKLVRSYGGQASVTYSEGSE